jgi:hypothetical protein
MQVFGVSDFTVMLHHVEEMFRVVEDSRVEPYARATRAPTTPDTNVYFSVISNVVGTDISSWFFYASDHSDIPCLQFHLAL